MKATQKYASAAAFRSALEDRLKRLAQEEKLDLQRLPASSIRPAALPPVCETECPVAAQRWLRDGIAVRTARTTRDIDLALRRLPAPSADWEANAADVLESLREAGKLDLQDFFTFVFGNAIQDLDAAPYGGARFPVDARLAGRTFAKFRLDVSTGDVLRQPYELLPGRDWLGFAGIATASFPAVSPEEHFAEKLHAYTGILLDSLLEHSFDRGRRRC